jgi:hypothetical protein
LLSQDCEARRIYEVVSWYNRSHSHGSTQAVSILLNASVGMFADR